MPTIAFTGSAQRADGTIIIDLFTIAPSTVVAEDSIKTIALTASGGLSPSAVVAFGNVAEASILYMTSTTQLSVALTIPGPVVLTAFKSKYLIIDTTEITGATLTNLDAAVAATVRFLIGGAA